MKKVLLWLAKIFRVNLTVEKIVYKDKIIEVPKEVIKEVEVIKYLPNPDLSDEVKYQGVIDGDLTIEGNLLVTGSLNVTGGVTCLAVNEINNSLKSK